MYHHLLESEIHASHRRAQIVADRARVASTRRDTFFSNLRHGIGLVLIALGERLAERDLGRPEASAPVHHVAFRAGS